MKGKRDHIYVILCLGGLAILYLLQFMVHRYVPFMMDDLWYGTNLATGEPLHSLGDVVEGQVWHYLNWGGRSITHGILQMTLMSGEWCADILNLLMTLLLAYMICVVSGQKSFSGLLLSSSLLIAWNANAKMSMFWQAGLVNYVYSTVWILFYLWLYIRTADCPDEDSFLFLTGWKKIMVTVGMIPLGLITGWSNENMGPTCFLLALAVIAYRKWRNKRFVPLWMYLGAISALVGSGLVILAPGNFVRSAAIEPKSLGQTLSERFFSMFEAWNEFLFPVVIVLAVLLMMYLLVFKGKLSNSQLLLIVGMVLSYGAMVLSPHYPDRATFGTMVLGICVGMSLLGQIRQHHDGMKKYINLLLVSVWIYSLSVLLQIVYETVG